MKSIRLSLLVCFLVLMALALGSVSVLVYELAEGSLQAEEKTTQKLLQVQYESDCDAERAKNTSLCRAEQVRYENLCQAELAKLDDALLRRSQNLEKMAHSPWGRNQYQGLYTLGLLTAELNPQGHLLVPIWLAEVTEGSLALPLALYINFPPHLRL